MIHPDRQEAKERWNEACMDETGGPDKLQTQKKKYAKGEISFRSPIRNTDIISCKGEVRKKKDQLGLNLVRDIKENRKAFCKCIYKKRKKKWGRSGM